MSLRAALLDETLRSAWWRFVRLWRPMARWTLLVFVFFGLFLGPLLSASLAQVVFRDDQVIVGNEDLLRWLLTPGGISYAVVGGALAIMGGVVRYAGLFGILTANLEGQPAFVRETLFRLFPNLPALFRLCMAAVLAALLLLLPLALGLGGIYLLFLESHDINYYLYAQPPEWYRALAIAGGWAMLWAAGVLYLLLRSLPALPAFLDGHRPVHVALRRAWERTRGDAARVLWLLFVCVAAWLLIRAITHGTYFFLAAVTLAQLIDAGTSLTPILLTSGAWAAGGIAMDIVLSFIGFSFLSTVLTKFYYEDTDLHAIAEPVPLRLRSAPRRAFRFISRWLHPKRALPLFAVLLFFSGGLSTWFLQGLPADTDVTVIAHRAGAHLATENTLAALERSIEAGADYAEIDVQRTRDSVVVVKHDADLMRLAGDTRRITQHRYEDLRHVVLGADEEVPPEERRLETLDTFLEQSQGRIRLMIELKYYGPDPYLAEAVVERVRAYDMTEEVVIISLDLAALRQVHRLAPELSTGYVSSVSVGDLARLPVDHLAVSRPMATEQLIRTARTRDIAVHVWTLNEASTMLDAIERDADGIITDDPILARRLIAELTSLSPAERLLLSLRPTLPDLEEWSLTTPPFE